MARVLADTTSPDERIELQSRTSRVTRCGITRAVLIGGAGALVAHRLRGRRCRKIKNRYDNSQRS
jgi:hypothetical protein